MVNFLPLITTYCVNKVHGWKPEIVTFMSSCPLYTGANYMHSSLNGENETVLYIQ